MSSQALVREQKPSFESARAKPQPDRSGAVGEFRRRFNWFKQYLELG